MTNPGGRKSRDQDKIDKQIARDALAFRSGYWARHDKVPYEKAWRQWCRDRRRQDGLAKEK